MPAYVIAEIDVTDPEAYELYKVRSGPAVDAAGGKFIVRGGEIVSLEGDPVKGRIVVIEFADVDAAQAWYDSELYQEAIPFRQAASRGRVFLVDGYLPPLP